MFSKSLTAAALSVGLVAATAHAQRMPEAADPTRAGTDVSIAPAIGAYKKAQSLSQPTNSWSEANAAATSQGGHDMQAMPGMQHGAAPAATGDPHAGHTAPAAPTAPADHAGHAGHQGHAGHAAPVPAAKPDPHAHHAMPVPPALSTPASGQEDHSMHQMSGHAGHAMPPAAKPAAKPVRQAKPATAKPAPKTPAQTPQPKPAATGAHDQHDHGGHQ